jgi:hypothetical protein
VPIVQHDFGIYGGPDGDEVLDVIEALDVPVIAVLRAVPATATGHRHLVLQRVIDAAAALVVAADAPPPASKISPAACSHAVRCAAAAGPGSRSANAGSWPGDSRACSVSFPAALSDKRGSRIFPSAGEHAAYSLRSSGHCVAQPDPHRDLRMVIWTPRASSSRRTQGVPGPVVRGRQSQLRQIERLQHDFVELAAAGIAGLAAADDTRAYHVEALPPGRRRC